MMNSNTPEERGCQTPKSDKNPDAAYNTAEANFPNWAKDPFKTDLSPRKEVTDLDSLRTKPPLAFEATLGSREAFKQKIDRGLTADDADELMEEINNGGREKPEVDKTPRPGNVKLEETKKLLTTFKDKVANYPKHLSYEGSVVLCVMLSVHEGESVNIEGLPVVDRGLILSLLPESAASYLKRYTANIKVEFDEARDFVLTYKINDKDGKEIPLKFFNAVIHPQKLADSDVPVEKDGEKISVGGKIQYDKKRIQQLIGFPDSKVNYKDEESAPALKRQSVAGRNAFELRTDLIQMSMDLLFRRDKNNISPEEVVSVAKVLYTFVENKR